MNLSVSSLQSGVAELHNNYSVSLSGGKTASSHWAKVRLVEVVVVVEEVEVERDVSTGSIVLA